MRRHRSHDSRIKRAGATAVEFAIVALPLILLIFGCIEFARVAMMESLAEDAAFEAARHVMVAGATLEEAEDEANRILGILGTRRAHVSATAFQDGEEQQALDDDTTAIRVDISIPMSHNSLLLAKFTGDIDINTSATVISERYAGYYDGGVPDLNTVGGNGGNNGDNGNNGGSTDGGSTDGGSTDGGSSDGGSSDGISSDGGDRRGRRRGR